MEYFSEHAFIYELTAIQDYNLFVAYYCITINNGESTEGKMHMWQFYSFSIQVAVMKQKEVLPLAAKGKVRAVVCGVGRGCPSLTTLIPS